MRRRRPLFRIVPLALACAAPCLPAVAGDASASPVTLEWNLRLRHEHVEDAAFTPSADATTLRLRAGLQFAGERFSALVEGEGIASPDDGYNSGANGRTAYPLIADAKGAELNQAWLAWNHAGV